MQNQCSVFFASAVEHVRYMTGILYNLSQDYFLFPLSLQLSKVLKRQDHRTDKTFVDENKRTLNTRGTLYTPYVIGNTT